MKYTYVTMIIETQDQIIFKWFDFCEIELAFEKSEGDIFDFLQPARDFLGTLIKGAQEQNCVPRNFDAYPYIDAQTFAEHKVQEVTIVDLEVEV